jgi:hypothetical protein
MTPRLLLLASVFLVAACGGVPTAPATVAPTGTPEAPAGTAQPPVVTPDVASATPPTATGTLCHLLTLEEIEAATGIPAGLTNEVPGQCTWLLIGPDGANAGVVTITRDPAEGDWTAYRLAFDGEDLSGVGEAAYWVEANRTLYFVHRGNAFIITMGIFGEDADTLNILRSIALIAISRL